MAAGQMFVFMHPELVGLPAAVRSVGAEAASGDGQGDWREGEPVERRRPLSFATSRYADLLAPLAEVLTPPVDSLTDSAAGHATTADRALAAAVAAVTARVLALPDDRLTALVDAVEAHGDLAAHGADLLFVDAVVRLSLDPERPALARRATLVLSRMASADPPTSDLPAAAERRRLWRLLEEHPEPIVYNLARR